MGEIKRRTLVIARVLNKDVTTGYKMTDMWRYKLPMD